MDTKNPILKNMLNIIKTRRSIRNYENKIISKDDLKDLLEAGMYAPSAGNEQAWQFIVISGDVLKEYLELNKNVSQSAPFGILVCMDISQEKYKGMNTPLMECSCCDRKYFASCSSKRIRCNLDCNI